MSDEAPRVYVGSIPGWLGTLIEFGELPDDVLMLNRADGTYERRSDRLARRKASTP